MVSMLPWVRKKRCAALLQMGVLVLPSLPGRTPFPSFRSPS